MNEQQIIEKAKQEYLQRKQAAAERRAREEAQRKESLLARVDSAKIEAKAKNILGEALYQALNGQPNAMLGHGEIIPCVTLQYRGKSETFVFNPRVSVTKYLDRNIVAAWMLKVDEQIRKEQEQRKMLVQSLLKTLKEAEAAIDRGDRGQLQETQLPSVWDSIEEYHLHDEAELMTAYERVNTKLHQAWDRWIDEFVTELDQIEVEPTVKGVNEGMRKREKADQELEDLRYAWGFDADDPRLTDAFRRLDERIKAAREERERRRKALQREAAKPFVYYLVHYWAKTACKEDDEGGPCEQLLSIPALHADPDEGGWWTCVAAEGFGDYALRKVRLPYAVRVDRVEVPLEAWEEQEIPYWLPREQTPYGEIITLWPGMETK